MADRFTLPLADRRNLATLERLTGRLGDQLYYLRRNSDADSDDRIRFVWIQRQAEEIAHIAALADRRYERQKKEAADVEP